MNSHDESFQIPEGVTDHGDFFLVKLMSPIMNEDGSERIELKMKKELTVGEMSLADKIKGDTGKLVMYIATLAKIPFPLAKMINAKDVNTRVGPCVAYALGEHLKP